MWLEAWALSGIHVPVKQREGVERTELGSILDIHSSNPHSFHEGSTELGRVARIVSGEQGYSSD